MAETDNAELDIFLVVPPGGLEQLLAEEAREKGFALPEVSRGGVTVRGDWSEVWRANLTLRGGATRVLVRVGSFRAMHPAQLDKRSRKFPWGGQILRPDVPVKVEATCKRSRIYHAGAAVQRVEKAIAETLGAPIVKEVDKARVQLKVRIEDDLCTFSVDASGESCTGAATNRPWARPPRCARRSRPSSCANVATGGAMNRCWTRCADQAHS